MIKLFPQVFGHLVSTNLVIWKEFWGTYHQRADDRFDSGKEEGQVSKFGYFFVEIIQAYSSMTLFVNIFFQLNLYAGYDDKI